MQQRSSLRREAPREWKAARERDARGSGGDGSGQGGRGGATQFFMLAVIFNPFSAGGMEAGKAGRKAMTAPTTPKGMAPITTKGWVKDLKGIASKA